MEDNENLTPSVTKVKPYTVYDLSTRSVLTEDEVTECLKKATQKEYLKKIGEYGFTDDLAKANGDAPNFMILPSKNRSKSFSGLPDHCNEYSTLSYSFNKCDHVLLRPRSNTAPANYQLPVSMKEGKKGILRASRLVQPSSPGSAKRKVQQKLQRDTKQPIPSSRFGATGTASPLVKQLSNSRISNSKLAAPPSLIAKQNGANNQNNQTDVGILASKLKAPEQKRSIPVANTPKIPQPASRLPKNAFQRSSVPRLSQKNSDASSSDTNSESSSCRSTPISAGSGGISPLNGLTHAVSNSSVGSSEESIHSKQVTGIPYKRCVPTRASSALDNNKRSLDSLKMSRENTGEDFAKRKTSTSSIPRSKQSCDNLCENTTDTHTVRSGLQKPSSRRSSVGSCQGDHAQSIQPSSALAYASSSSKLRQIKTISPENISESSIPTLSTKSVTSSIPVSRVNEISQCKTNNDSLQESAMEDRPITVNVNETDTNCRPSSRIKPPGSKSKIKPPTSTTLPSPSTARKNIPDKILKPSSGDDDKKQKLDSCVNINNTKTNKEQMSDARSLNSQSNSNMLSEASNISQVTSHKTEDTESRLCKLSDSASLRETKSKQEIEKRLAKNTSDGKTNVENEKVDEKSTLYYPTVGKIPRGITACYNSVITRFPESNSLSADDIESIRGTVNASNKHETNGHHGKPDTYDTTPGNSPQSSRDSTPSPLYKLDIPSPDMHRESGDSISYPYNSHKLTHQNVELIIAERKHLIREANNIKVATDGYAEPEDRIKAKTNGYQIPVDSIGDQGDEDFSNNKDDVIKNMRDPFKMHSAKQQFNLDDDLHRGSSPFKYIQPKVIIPPPQLNSVSAEGGLAPVPNEYLRTPSSDVEDVVNYSFELDDIRKKAHQQAVQTWKKKNAVPEVENENDISWEEEGIRGSRLDSEVFYPPGSSDKKDPSEKFTIRRASEENIPHSMTGTTEDTYQLRTMTLGRDKKKKSKFKKFFQKLASKKDAKEDIDIHEIGRPTIEDFRTSICSYSNLKTRHYSDNRRRSDGALSLHSIHDSYALNATTPTTKRRYLFNLNFLRKGRRPRAQTLCDDGRKISDTQRPSVAVRALCSPDIERRSRIIKTRLERLNSEPTLYRVNQSITSENTLFENGINQPLRNSKKYRAPLPPNVIRPYAEMTFRPRVSNSSSISSNDDEASYINYPFSKSKVAPPKKPIRQKSKGSCSDPVDNRSRSTSCSTESKKSNEGSDTLNNSNRLSSNSDTSSAMSSESLSSFQRSHALTIETTQVMPQKRQSTSSSSLRRTPLRHSIDSYNKLIEVHRQTVEKIAYETSRLNCCCEHLQNQGWDGFETHGEHIQLGLTSYMVAPVLCKNDGGDQKKLTAWLQLNQPQSQPSQAYKDINYSRSTLHRNCLHICHTIKQDTAQQNSSEHNDIMPKAIQITNVYISPQRPKMTLSKYASITLEKHSRYPELYEKEVAMVLLQVVKGIQYLHGQRVLISSIKTDNIFILNNGEPSVTLSPRRQPNKCPAIVIGVLPTLGDSFEQTEYTPITNLCYQLAFLLYELLHTPYHDELKDALDISTLISTLPDLTIKSIYSRYLQFVINMLLGSDEHGSKSLDDLRLILEVILFGPTDISDHTEDDAIVLITKWHNRRCVDMVTFILKEASLIMLCASGVGHDMEKMKDVQQDLLLECEFLANTTASEVFRIAKLLNR